MKPIHYDRHARRRMRERGVEEEEAGVAIADPDYTEPSVQGRTNAFKFLNGRYIRVTFRETAGNLLVITVTIRKEPFRRSPSHEDRIQQGR